MGGTATGGMPATSHQSSDVSYFSDLPCAANVRICMLAGAMAAMFSWLGEPSSRIRSTTQWPRDTRIGTAHPLIAALFAARAMSSTTVSRGIRSRQSVASEVLVDEHLNARGAFVDIQLPSALRSMPHGLVEVDGRRVPRVARPDRLWTASPRRTARRPPGSAGQRGAVRAAGPRPRSSSWGNRPAVGRSRRRRDQSGSRAFPDGARAASAPERCPTFAWGHRNKRSLGVDRNPKVGTYLLRLVAASDVVFSSKPGPWTPLRLRFDELQAVNPAIVADDSSALSRTGPASRRMGYGPLVRAAPA